MQRGKSEMPCISQFNGDFRGFEIPNLADEHNIRIVPENPPHRLIETHMIADF